MFKWKQTSWLGNRSEPTKKKEKKKNKPKARTKSTTFLRITKLFETKRSRLILITIISKVFINFVAPLFLKTVR